MGLMGVMGRMGLMGPVALIESHASSPHCFSPPRRPAPPAARRGVAGRGCAGPVSNGPVATIAGGRPHVVAAVADHMEQLAVLQQPRFLGTPGRRRRVSATELPGRRLRRWGRDAGRKIDMNHAASFQGGHSHPRFEGIRQFLASPFLVFRRGLIVQRPGVAGDRAGKRPRGRAHRQRPDRGIERHTARIVGMNSTLGRERFRGVYTIATTATTNVSRKAEMTPPQGRPDYPDLPRRDQTPHSARVLRSARRDALSTTPKSVSRQRWASVCSTAPPKAVVRDLRPGSARPACRARLPGPLPGPAR